MPDQEGEGHGHMHRISDCHLHLGPASCLYEVGSGLTVVTGLSMTLLNELLMQLTHGFLSKFTWVFQSQQWSERMDIAPRLERANV